MIVYRFVIAKIIISNILELIQLTTCILYQSSYWVFVIKKSILRFCDIRIKHLLENMWMDSSITHIAMLSILLNMCPNCNILKLYKTLKSQNCKFCRAVDNIPVYSIIDPRSNLAWSKLLYSYCKIIQQFPPLQVRQCQ